MPKNENSGLGDIIREAAAQQRYSMRKLSEICDISPSTVSRILNGKQPASMWHLQAFSKQLGIPIQQLLNAAGIETCDPGEKNAITINAIIADILKSYEIEISEVLDDIEIHLKKYEQYAKTAAGEKEILSEFNKKIENLNGEGIVIERLHKLYSLYCAKDTSAQAKAISGSAILYMILMQDVIPDYVFPLGYLDDAIAVMFTIKRLEDECDIVF